MDTAITDLITRLQAAQVGLPDRRDLPAILTEEQRRAHTAKAKMAETVSSLRNIPNDLERPLQLIADLEEMRAATLTKQTEIEQAIASSPDWRSFPEARGRERAWQHQEDLRLQLRLLHENRLLRAPGEVFWNVADLDVRIAELNEKIATLRASHDALIGQAEALLGEEVRV